LRRRNGFGQGLDDDLLPDTRDAGKCCGYTREPSRVIADRARSWEEAFPDVEAVLDEAYHSSSTCLHAPFLKSTV
jgi:hypothetical protein